MTVDNILLAVESLAYFAVLVVIAVTLRGIRREIKRVADRMDEPE